MIYFIEQTQPSNVVMYRKSYKIIQLIYHLLFI